ncbi:MAG: pyridoxal phosphate-dependent aminotransferase [Christensenellaceae bacterium]|nr:pyridoxal phosphate-dependent aminotransferase [Christensenellaceae bacterium]
MALTVSHRCQNIAPSLTLSIDARAKEMKAAGLDVIGFGAGEPDFPTPQFICDAAKEALDMGITRYTPAAGTKALRKAICKKLERDNDMTYTYGDIVVSSGAKHSLYNVFQAIIDPGDEVLIPTPCWVSYPEMVRMAGGIPVYIPADESTNFIPTNRDIASRVTRRTKAIIITSPSNPNGSVWSREQLQFVADLAVSHPFYVVSDEIYEKLIYDGQKHFSIAQLGEEIKAQTFIVNGMSKAYAMTGWRIGYVAGPRQEMKAMANFQSHATSNANSIAQYAALKALEAGDECITPMVAEFQKRRDAMVERINQIPGLSCLKPQGAFYIMLNIKQLLGRSYNGRVIESSLDFAELLLAEKEVAVVPGVAFEAEGFCRLSYAIALEQCLKGLDRIEEFVRLLG